MVTYQPCSAKVVLCSATHVLHKDADLASPGSCGRAGCRVDMVVIAALAGVLDVVCSCVFPDPPQVAQTQRGVVYPAVSRSGQRCAILPASLGSFPEGLSSTASKIESNVTLGLAAADQQIARCRRLDWVGPVDDGARNQPRLAVMTNSGPARPAHRHIARLG